MIQRRAVMQSGLASMVSLATSRAAEREPIWRKKAMSSYRLVRGYKRAGDVLVENALADRAELLKLIFSALLNYRDYIELSLKAILEEHGPSVGVKLETKSHKLPELWALFWKLQRTSAMTRPIMQRMPQASASLNSTTSTLDQQGPLCAQLEARNCYAAEGRA